MAKCFIIGPIGELGSPIRSDADDFMKYIVTPVVISDEFNYEAPIRADSLNEPGRITSQIITLLMEAELVIADLTTNNANVFYELCLRHAIGMPVIHMAAQGTPLSFDIRDNRTIFYTMHSRDAEAAREELTKQIRHVRQKNYKPMNPILETVGIVNLQRSDVPEKAAIGQLMNMVKQLNDNVLDIQQQVQLGTLSSNTLAPAGNSVGLGASLSRPRLYGAASLVNAHNLRSNGIGLSGGAAGTIAGGAALGPGALTGLTATTPEEATIGVTLPSEEAPKKRK